MHKRARGDLPNMTTEMYHIVHYWYYAMKILTAIASGYGESPLL